MKKTLLTLVTLLIMLSAMSTNLIADGIKPPGNGISSDPYQVSLLDHLLWISTNSSSWGNDFIQTADIDASSTSGWNSGAGFSPIGVSSNFSGSYDGQGFTISGLTINRSSDQYLGFFSQTSTATIEDLGLINVNITGNSYIGGLVGINHSSSNITNCYSTGSVTCGDDYTGGLVGRNNGTVTECYSTCSVNGGDDYTGGLVGRNNGTVTECYSTGSVTVTSGSGNYVGGLIGLNPGTVTNCYSTGSVIGTTNVGGLVGKNDGGTVTNCYSTGSVIGTTNVGGLVGLNSGTVSNSFWDKQTSGQLTSSGGTDKTTAQMKTQSTFTEWDFDVDGISAGHNGDWIMAGYPHLQMEWSTTISRDVELQMMALDLDENYTLSGDIDASSTSTWNYDGISSYYGFSPVGNETANFTGSCDGDGHTVDDLSMTPTGSYYGLFGVTNGASINNLGLTDINITANTNAEIGGLVGYCDYGTTITDCYVTGNVRGGVIVGGLAGYSGYYSSSTISQCYSEATVSGTGNDIGGLVGQSFDSDISDSYSIGNVTGYSEVGGLVGYSDWGSEITECYSTGDVSGYSEVGGLIGYNGYASSSEIANCYSTSTVSGSYENVGGLVGKNSSSSSVSKSYSIGSVSGADYKGGFIGINNGALSASFWNTETSGTTTGVGSGSSSGVEGKTTAEMKTHSTYLNAGWSPSIWYMDPGADFNDGYPYLAWQNPGGTPLPVQLISFTASVNKNDVTLNWTTAWEVNNAGFDVERQSLAIGKDLWTKVGFVEGNGTTIEPKNYAFNDRNLKSGKYNYRLVQRDYNNRSVEHFLSDVVTVGIPTKYALSQNYPNPFNPITKIDYDLPYNCKVNIVLFDIIGREITTIVNKIHKAGYYTAEFNASHLASGVYFYRIIAKGGGKSDFIMTKKMILIK